MGFFREVFRANEEDRAEGPDLNSLFEEFYDRLVYFSFQIVGDKAVAHDMAQEAFIKYWQQRDSVAPFKASIKNFLYATVKNASLNLVRHAKVVEHYSEHVKGDNQVEGTVMEAMITAEVLAAVHDAIQSLPETYRLISIKGYIEGKKNQEIADELGMSVNTVKKQKQRALELLKLKLTPEILTCFLLFLDYPAGGGRLI